MLPDLRFVLRPLFQAPGIALTLIAMVAPAVGADSAASVGLSTHGPGPASSPAAAGPTPGGIAPEPPGKLVDVGGYSLHVSVTGQGGPTVVLLPGAGDFSFDWALVQPEVARFTRVVSYDRAGSAWSEAGPVPRTLRQEAHELRTALARLDLPPPYVLVGHSLGGLVARVFARDHPGECAGMVLVDATHEDTVLFMNGRAVRVREQAADRAVPPVQTLQTDPPQPPSREETEQAEGLRKMFGPPRIEPPFTQLPREIQSVRLWFLNHPAPAAVEDDLLAEELRDMHRSRQTHPRELGSLPLVSLAGASEWERPPANPEEEKLRQEKRAQKQDLAGLSQNGRFIPVAGAGHHVHLDAPAAVIAVIREMVTATRPPGVSATGPAPSVPVPQTPPVSTPDRGIRPPNRPTPP